MNNSIQEGPIIEVDDKNAVYSFESSFAQQRLWLIDQMLEERSVYNLSAALRIREPIRLDALEYALCRIIERHDSLRTTFTESGGAICQLVRSSYSWKLLEEDWSGIAEEEERWLQAVKLADEEARAPFDLEAGPLYRFRLLRLGTGDSLLLITLHHIVSDGWSTGIIIRELSHLYASFVAGRAAELPELSVQYADFAHYQRDLLEGGHLAAQLEYWEKKLGGELPVLQLAGQFHRPKRSGDGGRTVEFTIRAEESEAIGQLSQTEGVTSFMTLLAAYCVWLYRYSNQTDLLVGTPVAGRDSEELEGIVGFFVNSVVLRMQLDPAMTFRQVLQRVKATVLEAFANREVPFDKVVEAIQPERHIGLTPIFQTMFTVHQRYISPSAAGLRMEPLPIERGSAKFDLSLDIEESPDGLFGVLEYRADLFEHEAVRRMAAHFVQLLGGLAADPDAVVSGLPMLTAEELEQQLLHWNASPRNDRNEDVVSRIEEMAERHANKTAIVYGEQSLTYGELNGLANRLAYRLKAMGVGPEIRVGVGLERSPELVVGLLAVLKAGGAYVPLDPSQIGRAHV